MSSKPSQTRTIDPFAPYNSNVANRLTRMLTQNDNVLLSRNSLSLIQDSTSPLTAVIVRTGSVFKDDVLIEVTTNHQVDFLDLTNYIQPGAGFDEIGYYYVVLEYTYVKSRPAPDADIKILKPSQRSSYITSSSLLLLGVVKVINVGITQGIDLSDPFHNFDPENDGNKREYVKFYAGTETNLPTHDTFRDPSRLAYDSETDKFWLGYRDSWEEFGTGGSVINIDTTGTVVGQLCYVDSSGSAVAAIATSLTTGADIAIKTVGLAVDNSGKALTSGIAEDVPIETAVVITTGDLLYLSETEAGKTTNVKTPEFYQVVGRALTSGDSANPIDIIFTPKVVLVETIEGTITVGSWAWDAPSASYYHDLDISTLEVTNAVISQFYDDADDKQIQPTDVQIRNTGAELRVFMDVNTLTLNYMIAAGGGGGGGGGGGTSDHSLLLNLGYPAGHTGFAPSPHDNADHSDTYIESAGVTYNALLANLDIGTGATQVSQGDHTHSGLIPSGTVMLFGQAAAPVGWTKKTTGFSNNAMIVVTTGSGAGQGGSADARAFDPSVSAVAAGGHSHTTGNHTLTVAEIPSHRHSAPPGLSFTSYTGGGIVDSGNTSSAFSNTDYTGGGGSHNHGSTSTRANHNHTINYDSYDPFYFRMIAATKD